MASRITSTNIGDEIDKLSSLERGDLVKLWQRQFRCLPPKSIKRKMLERAAAYRMQAKLYGGLKPATRKSLIAIVEGELAGHSDSQITPSPPQPGSRLVREWQGATHTVDVLDNGLFYEGKHYRSLSAVALAITGAKWSGPRFFGI